VTEPDRTYAVGPREPSPPATPEAERRPRDSPRSFPALLRQLAEDGNALIQHEIALAKLEIRQSVRTTARNVGLIGTGAMLVVLGMLVLLVFLVIGLGILLGDRYWLSTLIVGIGLAAFGVLIAYSGTKGIGQSRLTPNETIATLQENRAWVAAEARELKRDLKDNGDPDGTDQR
jgi:hypothetical protein